MGDLEHIGLLKMDFLGLANLTVLDRARDIVRESRGIDIDLQHIPLNDAKTFQMLSEGETTSIFQLEGAGMRRYIRELKPTSVADIAAMVALYRPGPMASIPRYIQAKHGEVSITYLHPRLKPILEPTYGVLVYQDQVLFIARDIADYSMGQADILRHAMGKKKPEEMRREKSNFLAGAQRNGISEAIANQIWDLMEPFAGYGFNAAHAACYATVAYQTAYLKANYPVEYMCAVLESALGNTDKIATAIGECRRLGIAILPPDINKSGARFTIESNAVRFGLAAIKNIGTGPVQDILDAREHGPFHSIEDFCQRVGPQAASKRVLESLIKAGALNSLARRSQLLSVLDRLTALAASAQRASVAGQKSMFDLAPTAAASLLVLPNLPEAPHKQRLAWEKELLGTYVSDHPLQRIAQGMSGMGIVFSNQLTSDTAGQRVTLAGMITRVRTITTKKGDPMAFVQLEDLQGEIEVVVFPSAYASTQDLWQDNTIVLVKGKVEVRDEKSKLICDSAKPYPSPELRPRTEPAEVTSPSTGPLPPSPPSTTGEGWGEGYHLHITVSRSGDQEQDIRRIGEVYRMLEDFPGQDRFSLYIPQGKGLVQLEFPNSTTSFTPALQERLLAILGPGSVRVERWSGTGDK
jgi:DNA polymerase-3 subunit alpha